MPSHEILTSAGANKTAAERRTCLSWNDDIAPVFSVSSLIFAMSSAISFIGPPRHDLGLRMPGRLLAYRRVACSSLDERESSQRSRLTP